MNNTLQLATDLGEQLRRLGASVTAAESCTGGSICSAITDVPGSSEWFQQGFVTYSNRAKQEQLGVSAEILKIDGAVSQKTVEAMLLGALKRANASVGVAVSGIAGPAGGSEQKPVGTVCLAWGSLSNYQSSTFHFVGDRAEVRACAVMESLNLLLTFCEKLETLNE
jgi:nicotinamide-nucleotide amidase